MHIYIYICICIYIYIYVYIYNIYYIHMYITYQPIITICKYNPQQKSGDFTHPSTIDLPNHGHSTVAPPIGSLKWNNPTVCVWRNLDGDCICRKMCIIYVCT